MREIEIIHPRGQNVRVRPSVAAPIIRALSPGATVWIDDATSTHADGYTWAQITDGPPGVIGGWIAVGAGINRPTGREKANSGVAATWDAQLVADLAYTRRPAAVAEHAYRFSRIIPRIFRQVWEFDATGLAVLAELRAIGHPTGGYIWVNQYTAGAVERTVRGCPPQAGEWWAVDIEETPRDPARYAEIVAREIDNLARMAAEYQITPLVYTSAYKWSLIGQRLADRIPAWRDAGVRLWVADYRDNVPFPVVPDGWDEGDVMLWQYKPNRKAPWGGLVDLNRVRNGV